MQPCAISNYSILLFRYVCHYYWHTHIDGCSSCKTNFNFSIQLLRNRTALWSCAALSLSLCLHLLGGPSNAITFSNITVWRKKNTNILPDCSRLILRAMANQLVSGLELLKVIKRSLTLLHIEAENILSLC